MDNIFKFNIENRRYTGSKASLSNWILELIQLNCRGDIFTDLFSGTGIIAQKASKIYPKIVINDFLYSNNIIYKAFFYNKNYDYKKLQKFATFFNNIDASSLEQNYFSTNYGGKYFSNNDSKIIGSIREYLADNKNLTLIEKDFLLASLIYSVDKIANTVGHYDAYFKNKNLKNEFNFNLIKPSPIKDITIYQEDSNVLVKKIKSDIVYIDPPYNSRQYSRFYHVLENLTKWDKPILSGVALKPPAEHMSEYCRANAIRSLENLISDLNCKYIAVSYNNTYTSKSSSSKNKIRLEDIEIILNNKGKTNKYEHEHKYFNSGKTEFKNHKEILFITKVK